MPAMWAVLAFLLVVLAASSVRGLAALREWWLDRQANAPARTIRPRRARAVNSPAPCGRNFTHLLLRLFGSDEDCRHCAEIAPREPLPFARRSDDGPGPAGGE